MTIPMPNVDSTESPPKRILYVIHNVEYFLSHRFPVAKAALDSGFEIHVAGHALESAKRIRDAGFFVHEVPLMRGVSGTILNEVQAVIQLVLLICRLRPDLVHCVTLKPVLMAGAIARLLHVPVAVHALTGLGYSFTSASSKARILRAVATVGLCYVLRYRNAVTIVQNPEDREALVRLGLVRLGRTILIRGAGVDLEVFWPCEEPKGLPLIVLPSRMLWDKGVGEFVEAARILLRSGVQARFVLAGDPDPVNPNTIGREQLEEWDREGVVSWLGHRNDIPSVLRAAHIVCLPSYREGLPKVLIEAAACGRSIVATDIPGCREIVRPGENGLLVPVRDAPALAEALGALIYDPIRRAKFGQAGRDLAEREFSQDHVARQTVQLYFGCLSAAGKDGFQP